MCERPEHIVNDPQTCRMCRGLCCQGHPGVWVVPERFLATYFPAGLPGRQAFRQALADSHLTLRAIDGIDIPAPQNSGRGCVFLTPDGCRLPTGQRPDQCLALIPDYETLLHAEIHCTLPPAYSTGTARKRWADFWKTRQPGEKA